MNVVIDTPTVKIWSDSNAPYAFSIFFSWPASEREFNQITEKYTELLKQVKHAFGEVYSICDISYLAAHPGQSAAKTFEACIEKQLQLNLKRKAFVLSKNFPQGLFTKPELVNSSRVSFHQTFQQALMEINKLRINGINAKLSIL